MEKVVTSEISKLLVILSVGTIGLSALMARMVSNIRGSFKPFQKSTIIYSLVCIVFFGLISLTGQLTIFSDPLIVFIFYQLSFLLFGVLHFNSMHRYLLWSGDNKSFWQELLFTVIIGLFGALVLFLLCRLFHTDGMEYMMTTSIFPFLIPFLFYTAFEKAVAIPQKIIRQWFYPIHKEMDEPDENKLKNLLVISFELKKNDNDQYYTNFRVKAPRDMEFGHLFYYFINDYNEQHPNDKILYIQNSGEPNGWIFFEKQKWYSIITHYKDCEKTIYINDIRENDIIICSRCIN